MVLEMVQISYQEFLILNQTTKSMSQYDATELDKQHRQHFFMISPLIT